MYVTGNGKTSAPRHNPAHLTLRRPVSIFSIFEKGIICMRQLVLGLLILAVHAAGESRTVFAVRCGAAMHPAAARGRLLVALARAATPEPAATIGSTDRGAPCVFARDADDAAPGAMLFVSTDDEYSPHDARPCASGTGPVPALPPGDWYAQAVLDCNPDLRGPRAPGNMCSDVVRVTVAPGARDTVQIDLTRSYPPDELPPDGEQMKFVKIRSALLSAFHRRPMYLRAAVLLPKDFPREPSRRYPLVISIGGYGASYDWMAEAANTEGRFHRAWLADSLPRMIRLYLDGRGPFGDPYQVNSANNGPYGDALLTELIPYVEKKFRAAGTPAGRFLEGASTGGWVSLALQVLYPDSFNGTWSQSPDGVDFRALELVDIYRDTNAFINASGFERPAAREVNGDVLWTMRHEVQVENVLGRGNSYTLSGGQWGAWNAVYGPRGADGLPVPLWDAHTGRINHAVAEVWKRYDLRLILQEQWPTLGPKLRGKIHVWVGDADNFFLNNAVHMLDDFLSHASPPPGGYIRYGPGKGHVSMPMTLYAMLKEMEERYLQAGSSHVRSP